jgi:hypothetical protein
MSAIPDEPGEILEFGNSPTAPVSQFRGRRLPAGNVGRGSRGSRPRVGRRRDTLTHTPGFSSRALSSLVAPPRLPLPPKLTLCSGGISRIQRQKLKRRLITVGPQCRGAHPGPDVRATPRRMHQSNRNVHGLLQLPREEETRRRPGRHRLRRCALPRYRTREIGLWRQAAGVLNSQHANRVMPGIANFAVGVPRATHRQFHVRLPRAEKHVAHQNVACGLPAARAALRSQDKRTTGTHSRQHHAPPTRGIRQGTRRRGCERNGYVLATCGTPPHLNGPVALQYRVILKQPVHEGRRLRMHPHTDQHRP